MPPCYLPVTSSFHPLGSPCPHMTPSCGGPGAPSAGFTPPASFCIKPRMLQRDSFYAYRLRSPVFTVVIISNGRSLCWCDVLSLPCMFIQSPSEVYLGLYMGRIVGYIFTCILVCQQRFLKQRSCSRDFPSEDVE